MNLHLHDPKLIGILLSLHYQQSCQFDFLMSANNIYVSIQLQFLYFKNKIVLLDIYTRICNFTFRLI